jgi:hypothetical protein
VPRGKTVLTIAVFATFCLALAYWWSIRVGLPLTGDRPWWYGKDAHVRIQVVEEGHDLATVSMKLPKGMLDTMVALGTDAKIEVGGSRTVVGFSDSRGRSIHLRDIWKELQRLPQGEKLKIEDDDGTVWIWIEGR